MIIELAVGAYAVVALSVVGLFAGLIVRQGKLVERVLLIAAGIGIILLDICLNYAASALSMFPSRSLGEILLFLRAPPGDVLVPVGYVLIAFGLGSLARKFADRVLEAARRNGS
jgi:hypothetical protein